jgi:hypothetical protein
LGLQERCEIELTAGLRSKVVEAKTIKYVCSRVHKERYFGVAINERDGHHFCSNEANVAL